MASKLDKLAVLYKIFKQNPKDYEWYRIQQVSLRRVEAEKIFYQLDYFHSLIMRMIWDKPLTSKTSNSSRDDTLEMDVGTSHWFVEVSQSANRMVRVCFKTYNHLQPYISTYFQVKLFAKKDRVFKRESIVSLTLQELKELASMNVEVNRLSV